MDILCFLGAKKALCCFLVWPDLFCLFNGWLIHKPFLYVCYAARLILYVLYIMSPLISLLLTACVPGFCFVVFVLLLLSFLMYFWKLFIKCIGQGTADYSRLTEQGSNNQKVYLEHSSGSFIPKFNITLRKWRDLPDWLLLESTGPLCCTVWRNLQVWRLHTDILCHCTVGIVQEV